MLLQAYPAPSKISSSIPRQCLQFALSSVRPATSPRTPGRENTQVRLPRSSGTHDLVAVSNICVDVVLKVDQLPPLESINRRQLLAERTAALADTPDRSAWEVGGSCNVAIAAARLGLSVATCGNIPSDVYGHFLSDILQAEGIHENAAIASPEDFPTLRETLLVLTFVAPGGKHAFCSRYDLGPWPLLKGIGTLAEHAHQIMAKARAVIFNGFVFDELPPHVVAAAAQQAQRAGAAIFFDPGPRAFSLQEGPRRAALDSILDIANVVLMTEEEALAVTGKSDPSEAAKTLLTRQPGRIQWVVIKLGRMGSELHMHSQAIFQPGFKVELKDSVGCGDSMAAAIAMGFIRQRCPSATLTLANAVGGATAMGFGAGRSVACRHDVTDDGE
ncbi:hypothetical protein WJX84_011336 [Apatococcus fuscideae]|uniref:Carbohydrate kinase PfkB domain-containing protein n=1 Tax=Apatococcus fuscideae TaxID=2026836 RepID=A0AAW1SM82_9CHLO